LQKQAIENARAAFSRLPSKDAFFQQCIDEADSIPEVVRSLAQSYRAPKDEKSTQLLQTFQLYKLWLHDVSEVVDIAVQTQAGIRCPLWAPINFVLKV
jgi:ferritin